MSRSMAAKYSFLLVLVMGLGAVALARTARILNSLFKAAEMMAASLFPIQILPTPVSSFVRTPRTRVAN